MRTKRWAWAYLAVIVLIGCGKDRTQEDYENEKVKNDLAKIQSVSGTYSGVARSESSGAAVGAVSITLRSDTRVGSNDSFQESVDSRRAVLAGSIELATAQGSAFASFNNGTYDSTYQLFNLDLPIKASDSVTLHLLVSGSIDGGVISARVDADGYLGSATLLSLKKDAILPDPSAWGSGGINKKLPYDRYTGVSGAASGKPSPVRLSFTERPKNSDQEFLNVFLPVRFLDVLVEFPVSLDDPTPAVFTSFYNAEWDQRRHTLKGQTSGSTNGTDYRISITCNEVTVGNDLAWDCYWKSSIGPAFSVVLTPIKR